MSWYTIPKYNKYEINRTTLEVRHKTRMEIRKSQLENGYYRIRLRINDEFITEDMTDRQKSKSEQLHRIVAWTFLPPPIEGQTEIDHINNDKKDNRPENLRWVSRIENANNRIYKEKEGLRGIFMLDKDTKEVIQRFSTVPKARDWIINNTKYTSKGSVKNGISKAALTGTDIVRCGYSWKYGEATEQIETEEEFIEGEVWRDIDIINTEGLSGYRVSSEGRFRGKDGKLITGSKREERTYETLTIGKNRKHFFKHVLVAKTFIENDDPENKTQVDHIDGNPTNNSISNLQWLSPSDNCLKRV